MSTFTWLPSFGAKQARKPQVKVLSFGGGYSQRTTLGMNHNPQSWNLTFSAVSGATADAVMAFLDTTSDGTSFSWKTPDGVTILVTCLQYDRGYEDEDKNTVTAVFTQVYGN